MNTVTTFRQQGVVTLPTVISLVQGEQLLKTIYQTIKYFIDQHQVTRNHYLAIVNRWPLVKLIDQSEYLHLVNQLRQQIQSSIGEEIELFESDVLFKSQLAPIGTVCHQDISYAWKRPYACSLWVPLTMIDEQTSRLMVLPGSHQLTIKPAVDFWVPNFHDPVKYSAGWQSDAIVPAVDTCDGILFSSQIWHASTDHRATTERVSLVFRWGNERSLKISVPEPHHQSFGLWTCGRRTQQILHVAWNYFNQQSINDMSLLITGWIDFLSQGGLVGETINVLEAITALKNLKLLNDAYHLYGGGDSQGIVYSTLWTHLLSPLQQLIPGNHLQGIICS